MVTICWKLTRGSKGIRYTSHFSLIIFTSILALWLHPVTDAAAQDQEQYILSDSKNLEMKVYIIGEVQKPGEYIVADRTNVAELIAKAAGPTPYSNMKSITITRYGQASMVKGTKETIGKLGKLCIRTDVDAHFKSPQSNPAPVLQPGDIVLVPKNNWNTWKNIASVTRDIAVVSSAYFLYLRAVNN